MRKNFFVKMSDGFDVYVNRWIPEENAEIKGVVQLHHGLAEHSLRYDRLGTLLAQNGYILNAYDMRGHGQTAANAEENKTGIKGKLADKDGFNRVVEDLKEMIDNLKAEYSGKKTVLLGHSFGSFVSQGYIEKYGDQIDGCILCGTAGPQGAKIGAGKVVASVIKAFRGKDTCVPLLEKMAFGSYNNRIENPSGPYAWLSANEENIRNYENDPWCGIPLTASFFCDMLSGLAQIHKKANIRAIPNTLPVLFIYGSEDPVGAYGKTIRNLYDFYKNKGMLNVMIKEYKGDRHEILNEDDKESVESDILGWITNLRT